MNILLISTGLRLGGAELQICNLADEYIKHGHNVMILTLENKIEVRPLSVNVTINSLNIKKNILSVLRNISIAKNIIKKFKPDVVHSHMIHANIFSRILRLFVSMPKLISTAHSSNDGGIIRIIAYRLTHRLANLSTNVSKNAVNSFEIKRAVPKGGMMVQYNGINIERFTSSTSPNNYLSELNIPHNSKVILAIGRLTKAKDYPNLFNAINKLKHTNITLLIAGDGKLQTELKIQVKKMGLSKKILFLGNRNDVPMLINFADLLVLSSEWEGFPTVIGEAMAGGCPVVTTDAGGAKEWFPQENLDLVVPIKNSTLLANKIDEILSLDVNTRIILINKLKTHVINNFSLSKIAQDWINIYRS
ncbi:glycosyltransferase [Moellerella wisconsensis]|uniref:glycosyltransferase n=1 Tax=Moellerella wisconsensis TaxID=158849 RepID=UPI001F4D5D1F|nr:glycosyltransferase [Moellerella wisconsensis]UNH41716.1 glycosyltransferase [Moellerella wisconsensis]